MMKRPGFLRVRGLCALLLLVGCGDDITLPPANVAITEQQITIYALTLTPVNTPSAYSLVGLAEIRTDQSNDFDFAFDIGPDSVYGLGTTGTDVAVLLPRAHFGFNPDGGLQPIAGTPFDSANLAPEAGYEEELPVPIDSGATYFVASRRQQCSFNFSRPRYARLRVESLDMALRKVVIRLVIDPNCGYRSLAPGIPTR